MNRLKRNLVIPSVISATLLASDSPLQQQPYRQADLSTYAAMMHDHQFSAACRMPPVIEQRFEAYLKGRDGRTYGARVFTRTVPGDVTRDCWLVWDQSTGKVLAGRDEYMDVAYAAKVRNLLQRGRGGHLLNIQQTRGNYYNAYRTIQIPDFIVGVGKAVIGFLPEIIAKGLYKDNYNPRKDLRKKVPVEVLRGLKGEIRERLSERGYKIDDVTSDGLFQLAMRSLIRYSADLMGEADEKGRLYVLGKATQGWVDIDAAQTVAENVMTAWSLGGAAHMGLTWHYGRNPGDTAVRIAGQVVVDPVVGHFSGDRGFDDSLFDFYIEDGRTFSQAAEEYRMNEEVTWGRQRLREDADFTMDLMRAVKSGD